MLRRVKALFGSKDTKRLLSNFLSLFSLQALNYLLPLITLPYLVRVLGVEYFGLLAFATAVVAYFQIVTDYGFNLTAVREISAHRDNTEKVVEVYSSVMTIKILLMVLSFFILLLIVFVVPKFREDAVVYLLTFGLVVGQTLLPVWFFQGVERMKYLTYFNIGSKLIFTVAIFVFVKDQADYYLVPLFNSVGAVVCGLGSLVLVKKLFGVEIKIQSASTLKRYLVDGWHVFVSRVYVSLYTTTNTIVLGLFTNNTVVGYYSIAEKIVSALSGVYIPITQVAYPYMVNMYKNSKERFFVVFDRFNLVLLIGFVFLTIFALVVGQHVIRIVMGEVDEQVLIVYSVLVFSIIASPFGASYTNALLTIKENRLVSAVVRDTLLLNCALIFPLIYFYQAVGLALLVVITGVFHATLYFYSYKKAVAKKGLRW